MRTDKWHDEEMFEIVYGSRFDHNTQHEYTKYEHLLYEPKWDTYKDESGYIYHYKINA